MAAKYQESRCLMNLDNRAIRFVPVVMVLFAWLHSAALAQSPRRIEGFTEPYRTVVVASAESGILDSLAVKEGDSLQSGEIIATLDLDVLDASWNIAKEKLTARGNINAAIATLKSRENHFRQIQKLFEQEHASDKEVKQAELDFELAKANVESANDELRALEMELKRIEAQRQRRIIRAPISGQLLELPREVGEAITATESQVATIVALDMLRVRFFLPTDLATHLQSGQVLRVEFASNKKQADATIDFVSPVTDSKSGTVRVELLIDNRKRNFRSGVRCFLGVARTAKRVNH